MTILGVHFRIFFYVSDPAPSNTLVSVNVPACNVTADCTGGNTECSSGRCQCLSGFYSVDADSSNVSHSCGKFFISQLRKIMKFKFLVNALFC